MLTLTLVLAAAPLAVGNDFAGFEQTFTQKTDSDLGKKRMNDCGFRETTESPVLTFEVTASSPKDLVLELAETKAGGVLTLGAKHLCLKPGVTTIDGPGTYAVYLLDGLEHPGRLSAKLRLFSKGAASKQLARSVKKVLLTGKGPNPVVLMTDKDAPSFDPQTVSAKCAKVRVSPVAELVVSSVSRFELTAADRELFVVSSTGCVAVGEEAIDLEAGSHALWMESASESIEVNVFDAERKMALETPAGSELKLTALPSVFRARARKTPERDDYAPCEVGGRKPSFSLDSGSLAQFHLYAAGGLTDVTFDVIGDSISECNKRSLRFTRATRAFVFVNAERDGDTLVAFTDGKGVPVFWSPAAPAAGLSAADRAVSFHYPFWQSPGDAPPSALPLFATAPPELFVFLNKEVQEVPVTEPLLVLSHDGKNAVALRANGGQLKVRASALSTTVPASLTVPELKAPPPAKTTSDAWADAGPLEQARVEAWVKRQNQYTACIGAYMEKHDPAWGKSYQLIYVRSGINVSDVVYESARKACGEAKFNKDGAAFIAAINASHAKLVASLPGLLAKRLGR